MPYQVIILFVITIAGTIFSYFLLRSERKAVNILFSVFSIFASSWALNLGLFLNTNSLENALIHANLYYISAAGIPVVFFFFTLFFQNNSFRRKYIWLAIPFILLIYTFVYNENFIISEVFWTDSGKDVVLNFTNYLLYTVYFSVFVVLSYWSLIKNYRNTTGSETKTRLLWVIFGTLTGFILGMIFNLFLPASGNYELIWIGPLSIILMVGSIGYAIIKHKIFNLKVIATELFIFVLWAFILIRTIISETLQDQIANGVLLVAVTIVGSLLIRSVIREVRQREKLEKLTKALEKANARLKELDQLKTEFLSLASHQFRSPLAAMKGYSSLILEGSYGETNSAVKEAVGKIFQSADNLAAVVQDFLDVSRIEQGRMKYEFEKIDLRKLIEARIGELKPNIEGAGLQIKLESNPGEYFVKADEGKLNQVIINLVDNAQKYTKKGTITAHLSKENGKVLTKITDTGVGISKEDISKLFSKFVRSKDANEVNVQGTGLGLYIVKKIVEAHKGKIWVESEGVGKGSTFFLELDEA